MCSLLHTYVKKFSIIFKPFSSAHQFISGFGNFASFRLSAEVEQKGHHKALKVLDFIIPKSSSNGVDGRHNRLIQGCMQDLLEICQQKHSKLVKKTETVPIIPDTNLHSNVSAWWASILVKEDAVLMFLELKKRGISPDKTTLSGVLSSCGVTGALNTGVQLHAFSTKTGFDKSIEVGSSLISLYSKCSQLGDAYQVFEEMPMRNTVSWTAIIAGYAQHWQIETCLHLFILMRQSALKPNDFTFASLLSACTDSASLGLGRSVHSLEIRMGFDLYMHVSNALISMYAKCGSVEEAHYVFKEMLSKDLISWNSMIFGYAQYGLAAQSVDLLKEMNKQNIVPDAISFLGVLSSCRHAGLVEQGHQCFSSMLEHGIEPELDHYSCMVDLLGRAGLLEEALDFLEKMPIRPNAIIWGSLLSSCRVHGNVWIGIQAAESRLLLEPGCAATHVQLANLYASIGCWNRVAEVRKRMKERGLKTCPGYSWIEIGNMVYRFRVENISSTQVNEILPILNCLASHMKCLGYMPKTNLGLHDEGFHP